MGVCRRGSSIIPSGFSLSFYSPSGETERGDVSMTSSNSNFFWNGSWGSVLSVTLPVGRKPKSAAFLVLPRSTTYQQGTVLTEFDSELEIITNSTYRNGYNLFARMEYDPATRVVSVRTRTSNGYQQLEDTSQIVLMVQFDDA